LFPTEDAVTVPDMLAIMKNTAHTQSDVDAKHAPHSVSAARHTIILLDGTWNTAKQLRKSIPKGAQYLQLDTNAFAKNWKEKPRLRMIVRDIGACSMEALIYLCKELAVSDTAVRRMEHVYAESVRICLKHAQRDVTGRKKAAKTRPQK
jgi:DTW domain-containing protein YfiP